MCRFMYPQFVDISPGATRNVEIKFVPYAIQTYSGVIELINKNTDQKLKF